MLGIAQEPQLVAIMEGGAAIRVELPDQTAVVQVAPDALFVGLAETEVVGVAALAEGPRGPKGDTGDQGAKGEKGDPGDPGQDGQDGTAATIAVGSTTTGAPGTDASVTNTGTSSAAVLAFVIPRGSTGEAGSPGSDGTDGADGAAATIAVGTVTTGAPGSDATVVNSGTATDAVFDITIPRGNPGADGADSTVPGPQGDPGADGAAATIAVGTVTTVAPGDPATVTNSGTANAAMLDFELPQGATGAAGSDGADGADGLGFTWRGGWSSGTTYALNDVVIRQADTYVSTSAGNVGNDPLGSAAWALFVPGMLSQGVWSASALYGFGDVVSRLGSGYVCIATSAFNQPPESTIGTYWALLAAKGDTGAPGADGADGAPGVVTATPPLTYDSGTQTVGIDAATPSAAGSLSAADKTKLDSLTSGASVSSVGLTVPSEFSVSGSPVTTSGTLVVTKANQSANQVYAGPASGSAAAPGFRVLALADVPGFRRAAICASGAVQSIANNTEVRLVMGTIFDQDAIGGMAFTASGNLTGTVSKSTSSLTVTGSGTAFTTELSVGQVIKVPGSFDEWRTVTAITDDTHLTVDSLFFANASGQTAVRDPSFLVCRLAGYYMLGGYLPWANNSTGNRTGILYLNEGNTGIVAFDYRGNNGTSLSLNQPTSEPYLLNLWDRLSMVGIQTSGGSLNTQAPNLGFSPRISMTYYGQRA